MATSTSSLGNTTGFVVVHTPFGTLVETPSESDAQMVALQPIFELLGSDEMVIAESGRTKAAAQRAFGKLLQNFQRVSEANDTLRAQKIQLTGQINQLTRVHEAEKNALNEGVGLEQQRVQTTQQEIDEAVHQSHENVATAMRRQLETVQLTQDLAQTQIEALTSAHRAQKEALESSFSTQRSALIGAHRSEIATLNQSHQNALSSLQNQLTQKRGDTQATAAVIAHKEQEVQRLKTEKQNLTPSISAIQSQIKSLTHEATVLEAAYGAGL